MIEIRFHGRGGQGAVTSAEIIASAAIADGKFAQAFPSFGPERRGAPVVAFTRISTEKIENRSAIEEPDIVVVLDPALIKIVRVTDGLKEGGTLVLNTSKEEKEIRKIAGWNGKIASVDATRISLDVIGTAITNMVMLGALIKAMDDFISIDKVNKAIAGRFDTKIAEKNIRGLMRALKETIICKGMGK